MTLRSRIPRFDRLLNFSSGDGPFRLVLGLAPDYGRPTLKTDLAVDRVEFQDQSKSGDIESAIMSGTVRFPDLGRSERLNANDFLMPGDLRSFLVRQVSLSKEGILGVKLYGAVGNIKYGPEHHLKSERFTLLSAFAARPVSLVIPAILLYVFVQWLAWRRFGNAIRL